MADIVIKIKEGTQRSDSDLCKTCSRCHIMTTDRGTYRRCTYMEKPLKEEVRSCNMYYDRSQPSLRDLYETAWILQTTKSGTQLGFIKGKDWVQKNNLPDDYYD